MFKLKIKTHSGEEYVAKVDEYTPSTINEQLNKNEINTVAFGDIIVSRIDVKSVVPVEVPPNVEKPNEEEIPEDLVTEEPSTEEVVTEQSTV
ncbi:hypothetical protein P9858_20075 [Niallia circulans]|uniref:hypothetical protein n=1 Tax=Niallia circulans TaxID=1397 RepID=UPI002E203128|nr:hypothetical protein [Niallia circulans]